MGYASEGHVHLVGGKVVLAVSEVPGAADDSTGNEMAHRGHITGGRCGVSGGEDADTTRMADY